MARRRRLVERRTELGLTQAEIARRAMCDEGTIRRYEAGTSTPRPGDRRPLAAAYEWTIGQLAYGLSDDGLVPNGHQVPEWLGHLASLEQAAAQLSVWEPLVVHGLLQTPEYAFAVERADAVPRTEEGIARRVETRMARQAALDRIPDPLELAVVLDESVLHRIAGDRDVMAGQLEHLADMAERPNIDLRVLPLDSGRFSAAFGSFTLFTSPGAESPFMACTEDRAGPHYLDRANELDAHITLFQHLVEVSHSPAETVDCILTAAKEMSRND